MLFSRLNGIKEKTKLSGDEACRICPKTDGPGWITYLPPWRTQFPGGPQAAGVAGMITNATPPGSVASINPKGLDSLRSILGGQADRGHLLGRQNGGAGNTFWNLVPLEPRFNQVTMRAIEGRMRAGRSRETVCFFILPTLHRRTR